MTTYPRRRERRAPLIASIMARMSVPASGPGGYDQGRSLARRITGFWRRRLETPRRRIISSLSRTP